MGTHVREFPLVPILISTAIVGLMENLLVMMAARGTSRNATMAVVTTAVAMGSTTEFVVISRMGTHVREFPVQILISTAIVELGESQLVVTVAR
jgi:hypothetical protein